MKLNINMLVQNIFIDDLYMNIIRKEEKGCSTTANFNIQMGELNENKLKYEPCNIQE